MTTIGKWFNNNTTIQYFNELQHFTGLTFIYGGGNSAAFYNCTSLKEVTLPSTVKEIQSYAFTGCASLTDINLDKCLQIRQHSFRGCTSLNNVVSLALAEVIETQAFYNCTSLYFDELNLPNLTSLGQNALYGVKIKKLTIGVLATNANDNTQNYGDKQTLEEIILTDAITSIPNYSFVSYANAKFVMNQAGITSIGAGAFKNSGLDGEVNFPNLTGIVGESTFRASKISSVKNLGNITEIGTYAFQNCDSLEFVDLPATLTKINNYAFSDNATPMTMACRATTPPTLTTKFTSSTITAIYVPASSMTSYAGATNWSAYASRLAPLEDHEDGGYVPIADAEVLRVLVANGVDTNGSGYMSKNEVEAVTSIGTWFKGNTAIQSFDELQYFTGVKTLGSYAFNGCTALESIGLDNVEVVGNDANWNMGTFTGCTSLRTAHMPLVKSIANFAFRGCSSLTSVYMPLVEMISTHAFRECVSLSGKMILSRLAGALGQMAFSGTAITDFVAPLVQTIGGEWTAGAFYNCASLQNVMLKNVTELQQHAFRECASLKSIVIDNATPPAVVGAPFSTTNDTFIIYVPDSAISAYQEATYWSDFSARIKGISSLATDDPTFYAEIEEYL